MAKSRYIIKNFVKIALIISFLISVIIVLKFVNFGSEIDRVMDHPLTSGKLSLLDKTLLVNYTMVLFFPMLLSSVIILLSVFLFVVSFLRTKNAFYESIWPFGTLAAMHFASFLCLQLLQSRFLSNLLLVPFYFLLPILILIKHRKARLNREIKKLILFIGVFFVVVCISANNTKLVPSLPKEKLELAVIVLIVVGLLAIFNYKIISKSLSNLSPKTSRLKNDRIIRLAFNFSITVILLSIILSICGFLWENQKTTIHYKHIESKALTDTNVILIVIDALRADHLGCYEYKRPTSPHMDALAKEGFLFKNCYTQASWTKPSTASLLTSLYPPVHQAIYHGSALPDEAVTFAEILKEQGYLTYGYVANPNLKTIFNFDQGFDFYDDYLMRDKLYYAAMRNFQSNFPFFKKITGKTFCFSDRDNIKLANERIIPWLEKYKTNNFFMYLHYMDPHDPYSPPAPYDKMYPYVEGDINSKNISLYDGEIRFADEHIGRLFEKLKSLGVYDKTLIVITSDHGEAFGEHNDERHGHTVYNELLKVPLIIKHPGSEKANVRIKKQVRSIDILPSILDLLNISYKKSLDGASLSTLMGNNEKEDSGEYIYVNNNYDEIYVLEALVKNNYWKYIYTEKSPLRNIEEVGHEELYDLIDDPRELNNLIKQHPEISKTMRKKLDFYKKHCEKQAMLPSQVELDKETIRNLKSLGYLH